MTFITTLPWFINCHLKSTLQCYPKHGDCASSDKAGYPISTDEFSLGCGARKLEEAPSDEREETPMACSHAGTAEYEAPQSSIVW